MVAFPRTAEFREQLAAAQATAHRLRIAAFVDYAPLVCGVALRPVTLRTYTLLLGWGNAFVCGGPVALKDIVQFIWAHHPAFGQFATRDRRRVVRRVEAELRPAFPTLSAVSRTLTPFLARGRWFARQVARATRHFIRPTAAELTLAAIAEIRRILHEALHDFPPGDDDAPPSPYALTPQFVSLMVRGYSLDFPTARSLVSDLPLKELIEYIREILHRLSRGKDKLLTAEEARVWCAYLDYQNAAAASVPAVS